MDKKNRIKIKKNVKYSICSCGYSKKIPYCDNQHRIYNQKNNINYKSEKIYANEDIEIELTCSNWDEENE